MQPTNYEPRALTHEFELHGTTLAFEPVEPAEPVETMMARMYVIRNVERTLIQRVLYWQIVAACGWLCALSSAVLWWIN